MRPLRALAAALAAATLLFATITVIALEGGEVVLLRTFDADGRPYDTRTWIADDSGFAWIEAATPERPFLQRLRERPDVEVVRGEVTLRYRATPVGNPEGHKRIRRLLAEKYGWADRWIGFLQDTSASVAIRLEGAASGHGANADRQTEAFVGAPFALQPHRGGSSLARPAA